jgi:hypothetical protein
MKIQFELGQYSHLRHFTSIVDELEKRGHIVVKTASTQDCPGLTKSPIADGDHRSLMAFDAYLRDDEWGPLAYTLRVARDYLRYQRELHNDSQTIKTRIRNMLDLLLPQIRNGTGASLLEAFESLVRGDHDVDQLDIICAVFESLIPVHPAIDRYLREMAPDLICVTPYIVTQYGQTDLVKAARQIGIPVVFMVGSWDNLTSKGAVQVAPDYTFVWNQVQREEAVAQHGIAKPSVRLVGAARFDDFWERRIEKPRDVYLKSFGLDPAKPMITYLGSSNLISGDERRFVARWIDGLRTCGHPKLVNANVLLRPHPKFAKGWGDTFGERPGVGVALSQGSVVSAMNNDGALFHSLIHADAVIGANTSAELEAGILGRPVFTIEDEYFQTGQAGTVHFHYLAGPLATVSLSLTEHYEQLAACLDKPLDEHRNDAFLLDFLRPAGLGRRSSEVTVDALESILEGATARSKPELAGVKPSLNASWITNMTQKLRAKKA